MEKPIKTNKPSLEDLGCPICLEVLIEPVRLCCGHYLCKACFDKQFEKSDFRCPLCKVRLSSWARRLKGKFVDQEKWKLIRTLYPKEVESKLKGESSSLFINTCRTISVKGEIEAEYRIKKAKFEEERNKKIAEENKASEDLIKNLLENEKLVNIQLKKDEEFAKSVDSQLNFPINLNVNFIEKKDNSKKATANSNLPQNSSEELIKTLLENEKLAKIQLKKDEEFAKSLDSQLNFRNNLKSSFSEKNDKNRNVVVNSNSSQKSCINKYLKPSPSKDLLKFTASKKIVKRSSSKQKNYGIEKFFSKQNPVSSKKL